MGCSHRSAVFSLRREGAHMIPSDTPPQIIALLFIWVILCAGLAFAIFRPRRAVPAPKPPPHPLYRGNCAECGQPVNHAYPWWTMNPGDRLARPVHDECWRKLQARGTKQERFHWGNDERKSHA